MRHSTIIFRADGGKQLGFGHLVRCATLAEALRKRGIEPLFITRDPDEAVRKFFAGRALPFVAVHSPADAEHHLNIMREHGATATVLDSYALDDAFRAALKRAGTSIVAIDDLYTHHSHADIVINHNPSADAARYGDSRAVLLTGPRFALIDPRLAAMSATRRTSAQPSVLVMMGGTDNLNQMERVLKALDGVDADISITAIGGGYAGSAPTTSRHPLRFFPFVNDLPERMAGCDTAITAGGITCMELASLGKPFLVLVTDKYQIPNAQKYATHGCARYAGNAWEITDAELTVAVEKFFAARDAWPAMGEAGHTLVDPSGVRAAADAIARSLIPL